MSCTNNFNCLIVKLGGDMKYTKLILLIFVCFVWLNVPSVFAQTNYVMAYPFTDFKGTQFVLKED